MSWTLKQNNFLPTTLCSLLTTTRMHIMMITKFHALDNPAEVLMLLIRCHVDDVVYFLLGKQTLKVEDDLLPLWVLRSLMKSLGETASFSTDGAGDVVGTYGWVISEVAYFLYLHSASVCCWCMASRFTIPSWMLLCRFDQSWAKGSQELLMKVAIFQRSFEHIFESFSHFGLLSLLLIDHGR